MCPCCGRRLSGTSRGTSSTSLCAPLGPGSHFGLCLPQPEPHAHLAMHFGRGGWVLLSTLRAARSSVEPGEAEVAVGGEGAHAEIGGDRQRLAICPLGLIAFAARGVYVPRLS